MLQNVALLIAFTLVSKHCYLLVDCITVRPMAAVVAESKFSASALEGASPRPLASPSWPTPSTSPPSTKSSCVMPRFS